MLMVICNASPTTHGSQEPQWVPIHIHGANDGHECGLFITRNSLTLSLQNIQIPRLRVCKSPLTRVGQSKAVC